MFKKTLILFLCTFSIAFAAIHPSKPVRILTCDGGGIRGAATLQVLKQVQSDTKVKIHKKFDVFAGSSTGAIIAVALAAGIDIDEILKDYEEMSASVFTRSSYLTLFKPEYDSQSLRSSISQILISQGFEPDMTLGDLKKKVILPTVALKDEHTGRWTLQVLENFSEEGKKMGVVDALLEATAAPTYFPSDHGHIDGGVGMNDPSILALSTAFEFLPHSLSKFTVFSIGTGYEIESISGDEDWGMTQWLTGFFTSDPTGETPLLDIVMDVQQQVSGQLTHKLLGTSYHKFNFPLSETFALDDYEKIPELLQYTEEYIRSHSEAWTDTCKWLKKHSSP